MLLQFATIYRVYRVRQNRTLAWQAATAATLGYHWGGWRGPGLGSLRLFYEGPLLHLLIIVIYHSNTRNSLVQQLDKFWGKQTLKTCRLVMLRGRGGGVGRGTHAYLIYSLWFADKWWRCGSTVGGLCITKDIWKSLLIISLCLSINISSFGPIQILY